MNVRDGLRPPVEHEGLQVAVEAAVTAGRHALKRQHDVVEDVKEDGSAVTEADYQCERLAHETLDRSKFDYPVFGEEYGKTDNLGDAYWVVDPIDGTRNYASGLPQYATSVGLVTEGQVEAGAIYAPATETLFAGARNTGVYVNGEHASVSDRTEADGANYIVTGTWTDHDVGRYTYGEELPSKFVKYIGCASLAMAYHATGRCDGGAVGGLAPWDIAAGLCLIREGQGSVQAFGDANDWEALQEGWFTMDNGASAIQNAVTEPLELNEQQ